MMPQIPDVDRHVFVYGTLRRGGDNDITRLHPVPVWVGAATIKGVLYDLGRYPGVVLGDEESGDGGGDVVGEVYAITPALERVLDEIEEFYPQQTQEYAKRELAVIVKGRSLQCLVYEIHPDRVQGKPRVASGDWMWGR
jgi:gamma-glutamylcyclotransferase (GGCT)/AIG2-like uncharacterized protein YtfP